MSIELNSDDVIISTYIKPNKSAWDTSFDSGIKLTHIPTGIEVVEFDQRSQHRNKAIAMKLLLELIVDAENCEPGETARQLREKAIYANYLKNMDVSLLSIRNRLAKDASGSQLSKDVAIIAGAVRSLITRDLKKTRKEY